MSYSDIFNGLFEKYPSLESVRTDILKSFDMLKDVYVNGGKVLVCGNGGSAADCEHIVGELMKGFKLKRELPDSFKTRLQEYGQESIADFLQGALPAISLVSQTSIMTAFSNVVGYDYAFAQQVYGYGKKNDALIAISTSGNAASVLNACYTAKALDMHVIGLSGKTGGLLKKICDVCVCVPFTDTAEIQEYHLPIYHAVCAALETEFFV